MSITDQAKAYHERMFPGYESKLLKTDPEFVELFDNFAFDEVVNNDDLEDRTRMMVILAALIGCQGIDEFKAMLTATYHFGVSAVEMKEIVYQAVAYCGIGRVYPFLHAVNDFCVEKGIELPLEGQSTTSQETRLMAGAQAQLDIFGESMRDYYKKGPEDAKHIHVWLTDNCFGDYYTRKGLDLRQRELMTFCFLASQGGCEPQLTSHAAANMRMGNDHAFLVKVVSQLVPFIGYPRCLNALACIRHADGGK